MDVHDSLWMFMDFYGGPWISMEVHEMQWNSIVSSKIGFQTSATTNKCMVVKALSDPNHDREMEVKIDGSHFVTFSISRSIYSCSGQCVENDSSSGCV